MKRVRHTAGTLVATTLTASVALPVAVARAGRAYAQRSRPDVELPAPAVRPATPPRVELHGFRHHDVVHDAWTGCIGTVHHDRVVSAVGADATVRWHRSFAATPLRDVASRLTLVQRRWV